MNRRNLAAGAVLAAVFALGAAAGGLAAHAWTEARYADELMLGPGLRHEQRMVQGLTHRLDLSEEQAEKVSVLAREHGKSHRALMDSVDEACLEPFRSEKERLDTAIRGLLTAEQRKRLDVLLAEQAERFGHRGWRLGQRGRGHGRGP